MRARSSPIGLVHSPGPAGADRRAARARRAPERARRRARAHPRPVRLARPRPGPASSSSASAEASGLPVGLHAQGAGGAALAAAIEAARAGADRIACAIYPVAISVYRVSAEALDAARSAAIGLDTGVNVDLLWEACELVDEALGDEPVPPLSPARRRARGRAQPARRARRRARRGICASALRPTGSTTCSTSSPQIRARDRLAAARLADRPGARLAGAHPRPVRAALADRRGRAARSRSRAAGARRRARSIRRSQRAVELARRGHRARPTPPPELDELRESAEGLAASEEELLLLALFGAAGGAARCRRSAPAAAGRSREGAGLDRTESERLRELIRVVQESGIGELTVEEGEWRVTVRRAPTAERRRCRSAVAAAATSADVPSARSRRRLPPADDTIRVESPMVGTFYRAPSAGRARRSSRSATPVEAGADALHPRGDEAHERGQGRARGASCAGSASRTSRRSSTDSSSSSSSR